MVEEEEEGEERKHRRNLKFHLRLQRVYKSVKYTCDLMPRQSRVRAVNHAPYILTVWSRGGEIWLP